MKNIYKQLLVIALFVPLIVVCQQAYAKQKVLIVVSSHQYGYWLPEVVTPYRLLEQAGFQVDIASPYGGAGRAAAKKKLTALDEAFLPKIQHQLADPMALSEVAPEKYSGVYIAGGAGPMLDLYKHPQIERIVSDMYLDGKPVSADCHGPAALAGVKLPNGELMVKGKRVTAKSNAEESKWAHKHYPFMLEDRLKEGKALFSAAKPKQPWVVRDGNLLTGQNPASVEPLTIELIAMLKERKSATNH